MTRMRWLESLLDLRIGATISPKSKPFEGIFQSSLPEHIRGCVTTTGERIDLDRRKLGDPIGLFVAGLHEVAHIRAGHTRFNHPGDQRRADAVAAVRLAEALGDDLASRVVFEVGRSGTIWNMPERTEILRKLIGSSDPRFHELGVTAVEFFINLSKYQEV